MFTRSDLDALMDAAPSPGVSLFMPTHVRGSETRQDPIRLKTLLAEARGALDAAGTDRAAAEALLAPAAALADDYGFWQHGSHGLALFLDDDGMRLHKVPIPLEPAVHVGPNFRIKPLLPVLAAGGAFRVLSVTAGGVRLHDASRFAIEERDAADLPQGVEAVTGDPDYENPLQASPVNRPNTGAMNISQAQVYGDSPEEWRKGRLLEFVKQVAAAVEARAARERVPIVLATDAEIAGHFAKLTALGPLLAGVVEGNPEALDDGALHEAAYAVMRPRLDADRREAIERFAALAGSGDARAAASAEAAAAAAAVGRVDTLFLEEGAAVWGRIDEAGGSAERLPDGAEGGIDLLDAAAALTLRQGSQVFVLPPDEMPENAPAAAILRY